MITFEKKFGQYVLRKEGNGLYDSEKWEETDESLPIGIHSRPHIFLQVITSPQSFTINRSR